MREIGQPQTGAAADQAVATTPIVISEAGSYRLITNIVSNGDGIEIRISNVTLDLNGFHIEANGRGVFTGVAPVFGIVVRNGSIHASHGAIDVAGPVDPGPFRPLSDCRVEELIVRGAGASGIRATIKNCIVRNNTVSGEGMVTGIECRACVVTGNNVLDVIEAGISANEGSLVLGNAVRNSEGVGLRLDTTTGYANNVLSNNASDVLGGVQIGINLCATSGICGP